MIKDSKHGIDTVYKDGVTLVFSKKNAPTNTTITYDALSRSIIVQIVEKCPRCRKTITKRIIRNIFDLGV